jgi:hypothetical protein
MTATTPILQLRAAGRLLVRRRSVRGGLGRLDERVVFVLGSPRSGTTFLAGCIGSVPGLVDLGEVHALKAAIPRLIHLDPGESASRIRRLLDWTRRLALVPALRPVEQTPETAFVLPALALAFPQARFVHAVRDGRDVVASLLERGWLSAAREGADDVGASYGSHARFWIEPGREREFAAASDARRAAWALRRYAGSALDAGVPLHEVRYEQMVQEPELAAEALAKHLGVPAGALVTALRAADARSVGRARRDLSPDQLAEVEEEAGPLLARLGYSPRPADH